MEEQVGTRIAEHMMIAPIVSFPTTDDDSDLEYKAQVQARRKSKAVSGRLHMAESTVMWQVTWHHKVTYTLSGQPAFYDQLDTMDFVNGYLTVMARETEKIKARMLSHLQEPMEDGQHYG